MTDITEEMKLDLQRRAQIPHIPTDLTYECRMAIEGEGPRSGDWADKPHRLVFDLCREIERLRTEKEELKAALREDAERMKADQDAIDSLRLSLSEARATGRREGMEEAARIAEGEITRAIFDSFVFNGETAVNRQGHDLFMSVVHVEELLSIRAAAIRAAMEKEE